MNLPSKTFLALAVLVCAAAVTVVGVLALPSHSLTYRTA